MIHAFTNSNFYAILQTEDNSIHDVVTPACSKYLFKFTNDMDGSVQYAYPVSGSSTTYERYSKFLFHYNATPDVYNGRVDLKPAGYWKYQVFQVTWDDCPGDFGSINMPPTEEFVFSPAANNLGVVLGQVTKGKLYVSERAGTEEISYTQKSKQVVSLTIIDGGQGYALAPTLTLTGGNYINQATATCTINAFGQIDSVTITYAGNGYTEIPSVIIGGTPTNPAVIVAEINEDNYIYTG